MSLLSQLERVGNRRKFKVLRENSLTNVKQGIFL